MLSGIQRHLSVVSLLLIAGAGLIILEGPVGPSFMHQLRAKPVEKQPQPATVQQTHPDASMQAKGQAKDEAKAINLSAPGTTWANTMEDSTLRPAVLGEIPPNGTSDPVAFSK